MKLFFLFFTVIYTGFAIYELLKLKNVSKMFEDFDDFVAENNISESESKELRGVLQTVEIKSKKESKKYIALTILNAILVLL